MIANANIISDSESDLDYDIDEVMNEDSGDRDNDGVNEPDDEEYLQNKRTAITKAVKGESVTGDQGPKWDKKLTPAGDGEEMTEAHSDNPSGQSDPDGPDNPAGSGEEMKGESLDHGETLADKPDKEGKSRVNDLDGTSKTESKSIKLAGLVNLQAIGGLTRRRR